MQYAPMVDRYTRTFFPLVAYSAGTFSSVPFVSLCEKKNIVSHKGAKGTKDYIGFFSRRRKGAGNVPFHVVIE